jgi:hypothetical protein
MQCFSEIIEFMSYWLMIFIGLMDVSEHCFMSTGMSYALYPDASDVVFSIPGCTVFHMVILKLTKEKVASC